MIWLHFLVISPGTQEQWEPSTILFPYFKGFLSEWELGVVLVWEWGSDLLGYLEFPLDFLQRFVISSSCEQRWATTGTEDLHKITHRKRHQWCVIEPLKKCSLARTYMCAGFHLTPFLCPKCSSYSVGSSPLGIGGCFDIGGCSLPNKGACTTWRFHMEYFFLYTFFGPTLIIIGLQQWPSSPAKPSFMEQGRIISSWHVWEHAFRKWGVLQEKLL